MFKGMMQCLLCVAGLSFNFGCVSSTPENAGSGSASDESAQTPLEAAVRRRIRNLPYTKGKELLADLEYLISTKEFALPIIEENLATVDPTTRANLLYVVGYGKGERAHRMLKSHVGAPEPAVRFEAAAGLVNQGDWSAVPVLLDCLKSEDKKLRYKSFEILRAATDQDFGYKFDAPAAAREQPLRNWYGWWEERRRSLLYNSP